VVALGFSFLVESRSNAPMLPLDLFSFRAFSVANLMTLFLVGTRWVGVVFRRWI